MNCDLNLPRSPACRRIDRNPPQAVAGKSRANTQRAAALTGTKASKASDKATAALAKAETDRTDAANLFAQAQAVLRKAEGDAAETAKAAKTAADALIADAQKDRDAAAALKSAAD